MLGAEVVKYSGSSTDISSQILKAQVSCMHVASQRNQRYERAIGGRTNDTDSTRGDDNSIIFFSSVLESELSPITRVVRMIMKASQDVVGTHALVALLDQGPALL